MTDKPFRSPAGSHLPFGEQSQQTLHSNGLRPFLGLGPRMLLTTLSPALLPLIFTVVHLLVTRSNTERLAATLKEKIQAACQGIATGAGSLQAIPRYLAMQTNKEVIRAARATVMAAGEVLIISLTIIEKVIDAIIALYRSLFLCTLQLAVQASIDALIKAVGLIKSAIGSLSDVAQTILNGAAGLFNANQEFTVPRLEEKLIPTAFQDSLEKLNNSIPDLNDLRNYTEALIAIPFNKLREDINQTRFNITSGLNESMLPVPPLQQLGAQRGDTLAKELCSDLDTSVIDRTARALYKLGTAGIVALCLVVVLGFAVLAFWQWMEWRAIKASVELVESSGVRDPWAIVAMVQHPMMEQRVQPMLDRWNLQPRTRNNLRWFLSYLAHPTCLALLLMSAIGLLVIQIQIAALHALERQARSDIGLSVNASTAALTGRLNDITKEASQSYAAGVNKVLSSVEDTINDRMFGQWIKTTSAQLNGTLVEFYDDLESILNKILGGTVFERSAQNFMFCVLGSKIVALEQGLTWVSEHARVNISLVPDTVLQLSNETVEELAAPVAAAAVGAPSGDDGGALGQLIDHFKRALAAERAMYAILLGLYGALVLIGLAIVIWHSGLKERWEHRRVLRRNAAAASPVNGIDRAPGPPPMSEGSFLDMNKGEKGTPDGPAALSAPGATFLHLPPSPRWTPTPSPEALTSAQADESVRSHSSPQAEECVREEGNGLWIDRAGRSGFRGARLGLMRDQGVRGLLISGPAPLGPMPGPSPSLPPSPSSSPRPEPLRLEVEGPMIERTSRALPPPPRQLTPVERYDAVDQLPTPVQTVDPFSDDQAPRLSPDSRPKVL